MLKKLSLTKKLGLGVIILLLLCCSITFLSLGANEGNVTITPKVIADKATAKPTNTLPKPSQTPTNVSATKVITVTRIATKIPTNTPSPQPISTTMPLPTLVPTIILPTNTSLPQPTNTPEIQLPTDTPQPPTSPGNVVIADIFFDGNVPRVESDERVQISNLGGTAVNLAGWRLNADDPDQNFSFPAFDLQPGQSCWIYTNEVHPETCGFSFNIGSAIWTNSGECGHLYNASGIEVSTFCY